MPASPLDPKTPAEWQEAVDAAEFFLLLDSSRMYGLIEGGPQVNTRRCLSILRRGKKRGITPGVAEQLVRKFLVLADKEDGCRCQTR